MNAWLSGDSSRWVFFGAALLLALSPGPDLLFVIAQSVRYGRRAGLWVSVGLCSGLIGHTSLVALGVGQWLSRSPWAMALLRYGGGAYLAYLGFGALHATFRRKPPARTQATDSGHSRPRQAADARTPSGRALYQRGVLMNLLNPKVSLFFLAFLPQFVSPARGNPTTQIILLGALFALAAQTVFATAALLAGTFGTRRFGHVVDPLCGLLFLGLALRLIGG